MEVCFLLVFSLAPFSTAHALWVFSFLLPWTLAPARFLASFPWLNGFLPATSIRLSPLLLILTFVVLTVVYLYGAREGARMSNTLRRGASWFLLALAGAALFGVTLLFAPTLFSNDLLNYYVASHFSAAYYSYTQSSPAQAATPLFGPLWTLLASLLMLISNQNALAFVSLFKGVALLSHLFNIFLVWLILGRIAPARRFAGTLIYAWNPLLLIELAVNARYDGLALCFVLLAIYVYLQQRRWGEILVPVMLGIAVSMNWLALLIAGLFLWYTARNRPTLALAARDVCWRALLALGVVFITFAPYWQGGTTFLALLNSLDFQHFQNSPLTLLDIPLRLLYSSLTRGISYPSSLMQPATAADATLFGTTLLLFALIFFRAMRRIRVDAGTGIQSEEKFSAQEMLADEAALGAEADKAALGAIHRPLREGEANMPQFEMEVFFTNAMSVVLAFITLASALFWPWYVMWLVWLAALRQSDPFSRATLLLSCSALLYYPLLYLAGAAVSLLVPICIFGPPFVYWIAQHVRR